VNISIILCHPNPGSFNHAIAGTVAAALREKQANVTIHDLHAEKFDPVYPAEELGRGAVLPDWLEAHCRELETADGLVIVHPNYWGRPPAMLCGWVDRVVRAGRAYRFVPDGKGGARPEGLLKAKAAVVFTTANTPDAVEKAAYGDPLETHWTKVVFGLVGVPATRRSFSSVIVSTPEQRETWLKEARELVMQKFV
jgi:putative NADPH-quinone reductase